MTAYSITPEGAALAAKEIAELVSNAKFTVRSFTAQTFANTSAAIILRHAEQSLCQQARKTSESSSRTDVAPNQNADSRQARETVEQAGSSSEGEMREALREVIDKYNNVISSYPTEFVNSWSAEEFAATIKEAEVLLGKEKP